MSTQKTRRGIRDAGTWSVRETIEQEGDQESNPTKLKMTLDVPLSYAGMGLTPVSIARF